MKAIWKNTILAESDDTIIIEGNHYFPAGALDQRFFKDSDTQSVCPWKGTASYYDVEVDGEINKDAAWYYPETSDLAKTIKGYIAFWKGIKIVD